MTARLKAAAIIVHDMDRSLEFYARVLGLGPVQAVQERTDEDGLGLRRAVLGDALGGALELVQYLRGGHHHGECDDCGCDEPADEPEEAAPDAPGRAGLTFGVPDASAARAALTEDEALSALGPLPASGDKGGDGCGDGARVLYCHDPDGVLLPLEEPPRIPPDGVDAIVYDFDGVFTDNRVWTAEDGRESVAANRSDGLAVGMLRRRGIAQVILSTEANPVVLARAAKIGLDAHTDCPDKAAALRALAAKHGWELSRVVFVGNDVNDLAAMALAGWPVAPADAHPRVQALARVVTHARGGHGVVRELADLLGADDFTQ